MKQAPVDVRECEACGKVRQLYVGSLPGIPMTLGRCEDCLMGNVLPLWLLVANTVAIDGLDQAADWWRETVRDSLLALGHDRAMFEATVADALERERRDLEQMEAAELASTQGVGNDPNARTDDTDE